MNRNPSVVIAGGGPAGLTAAYELLRQGVQSILLERDSVVGGLARTVDYKGFLLDIGGHAFYTKVPAVDRIWREVLGDDLIERPHLSSIYYKQKLFRYPVQAVDAIRGLGLIESFTCAMSYIFAQLVPELPETNFEAWVSNRFGKRLYQIFFQTYAERVWGMPCENIQAEWAAQRIHGLSLRSVVWNAIRPKGERDGRESINMLAPSFSYPRKGPGMMWSRMREVIESGGSEIVLHAPVERVQWEPGRVIAINAGGRQYAGSHFISSMPLRNLIESLAPDPPLELREAVNHFTYRAFITIAMIVRGGNLFPDLTIYVHDSRIELGRIQNYGNWSPELVPDSEMSCLGCEYFCSENDEMWNTPDAGLILLCKRELAQTGLIDVDQILDALVVRVKKAYPIYDETYRHAIEAVRKFLPHIPNLQVVGRNGMHRYNHQDHSMLTAILAARNIVGQHHDLWNLDVHTDRLS